MSFLPLPPNEKNVNELHQEFIDFSSSPFMQEEAFRVFTIIFSRFIHKKLRVLQRAKYSRFLYYLFISWFISALAGETWTKTNKYLTLAKRERFIKRLFISYEILVLCRVVESTRNQTHDAIKVNDVTHSIAPAARPLIYTFCHDNSALSSFSTRSNNKFFPLST